MRRAVTLLLLCGFALTAVAQVDRAAIIRLSSSVLKLEAFDAEGRFQLGSAVVVADGKAVTNCHVTRSAARVSVIKGGVRWDAPMKSADLEHDLCLLDIPGLAGQAASVRIGGDGALAVGQTVVAIGFTGGAGVKVSQGEVVALHRWDGGDVIQSSNGFSSGASGGALFDTAGALVGILTFRLRGGAEHYFSSPTAWLRPLLDGKRAPLRPPGGQAYWERTEDAQPYFLQAVSLEHAGAWQRLRELALRWAQAAPAEAEAPYMLALADEALGRGDDAVLDLRRCVELDSGYIRGWQRLARLQRRSGRDAQARDALIALRKLDARLALALGKELGLE